ncbi:MAG: prenyltransferase [Syntrophobacterales bacterium]|nr:MAG: prenyltransferase [Syntrophobacterales bacterium]
MRSLSVFFKETRPQFLFLTPACYLVGIGTASYVLGGIGRIPVGFAILAFIGALFSHIGVNVMNDYFDFRSGLDLRTRPTPFSGGSGILPQGLLSPKEVLVMGVISLLIAIGIGLYFLKVRGWGLLPLGLLGLLIIILYSPFLTRSPALCLLAPGLGFGPLMVVGTHFVLTGRYDWFAFSASLVPGFLVSNLLLINQFPDVEADRCVKRRHLPIVIGRQASAYAYAVLALSAFCWVAIAVILGLFPPWSLLALLPIPLAIVTIRGIIRNAENVNALISFLGKNVIYTLATPFLLGVGLLAS